MIQTIKTLILLDVLKKIDYNAKTTEIEGKKPNISGLATTCALTAVENDIPYVIKKNNNNNRL